MYNFLKHAYTRSLLTLTVFLFLLSSHLYGTSIELNLSEILPTAIGVEKLVIEGEGMSALMTLEDGTSYVDEVPSPFPSVSQISALSVSGPEVTLRFVSRDGASTSQKINSFAMELFQTIEGGVKDKYLTLDWLGVSGVTTEKELPKDISELLRQLIKTAVFSVNTPLHLEMKVNTPADPQEDNYLFTFNLNHGEIDLAGSYNDEVACFDWNFSGMFDGMTPRLTKVLDQIHNFHKVYKVLKPKSDEQKALQKFLVYADALADALTPLQTLAGTKYSLGGKLLYETIEGTTQIVHADIQGLLKAHQGTWEFACSNIFNMEIQDKPVSWDITFKVNHSAQTLNEIARWLAKDGMNLLSTILELPQATYYSYFGDKLSKVMVALIEHVGEKCGNGEIQLQIRMGKDGNYYFNKMSSAEVKKWVMKKLMGWG